MYAEIYNVIVPLFLTLDGLNQWRAFRGGATHPAGIDGCASVFIPDGGGIKEFAMYLEPKCYPETVGHEATHCAWDILDARGVKVDADNHEALTYLAAHIAKQVFLIRRKLGRRD